MEQIDMISVNDIRGYFFFIPNYQRGYRWSKQQVKELLDDVYEFMKKEDNKTIYCLQPLVVKRVKKNDLDLFSEVMQRKTWDDVCRYVQEARNGVWEVIDGQQRLTTLTIILQVLGETLYNISYAVLPNSNKVNSVAEISVEDVDKDVNLHFMKEAYEQVKKWKEDLETEELKELYTTFCTKVKLIWYESDEKDSIKVFTRLNVGRISLTSSELIKALFLNRENFPTLKDDNLHAKQLEISLKWHEMETMLQNPEFWLFVRNDNRAWNRPTRIDFLLELYTDMNNDIFVSDENIIGTDKYSLFRKYYEAYKTDKEKFIGFWKSIKSIYDILIEWYEDYELYHYVGYLVYYDMQLSELISKWNDCNRDGFKEYIITKIKKQVKYSDLEHDYFNNGNDNKRQSKPLLLLHNVETIVNQNRVLISNPDYQTGVFYKFPFHLFKVENWDVEHIDSNMPNPTSKIEDQQDWLLSAYSALPDNDKSSKAFKDDVKCKLVKFFAPDSQSLGEDTENVSFETLKELLCRKLNISQNTPEWKNMVSNYALLDSSTNRSYKNALFPNKRTHIVGKEKGVRTYLVWDEKEQNIVEQKEMFNSAFIPVCTKNIFTKAYSSMMGDPTQWSDDDATNYKNDIKTILKDFL